MRGVKPKKTGRFGSMMVRCGSYEIEIEISRHGTIPPPADVFSLRLPPDHQILSYSEVQAYIVLTVHCHYENRDLSLLFATGISFERQVTLLEIGYLFEPKLTIV